MKVTLVKKVLADGSPCAKCADVEAHLERSGYADRIDAVLIADERDPTSPGMQLAERLGVTRAPFFVVETGAGTRVYTVYFKFVREVLREQLSAREEDEETLRDNPDLDYL